VFAEHFYSKWHLAGYVSPKKCAGIVGCICYIFVHSYVINSKWQILIVSLFHSVRTEIERKGILMNTGVLHNGYRDSGI
jgi:hypothetical protein